MSIPEESLQEAQSVVRRFTLLAAGTGAMPIPAASAAVVAENAVMFAAIGGTFGVPVTAPSVLASLGVLGALNLVGRQVFLEGARVLGWGAGPLGVAPVSALGAATAAGQTWALGQLAIAIARNGGNPLSAEEGKKAFRDGLDEYSSGRWGEPPIA